MYEELIKTAKICCGDISTEDCVAVCTNPHDKRGEDVRFCRQWLIKDLYTALAALQAENAELLTQHRTEHCEAAEYDCVELGRLRDSISRMEAEQDALRDRVADFIVENADCLKIAIDTQDRHYLEVLIAQWRSAQWEG